MEAPELFAGANTNNNLYSTIREFKVKNKHELKEYLKYDFSQIFFTHDYVQSKLKLVGPVRLRSVHTT